jgi:hypothetical protein
MFKLRSIVGIAAACCLAVVMFGSCSVISVWRRANHEAKEKALQNGLDYFRAELKRYVKDKRELPQSLADLRNEGYASPLPDPITGRDDWQAQIGEDPLLIKGKRGVINIHSSSTDISSRGTPYNTW